jgi:hypothetical protein
MPQNNTVSREQLQEQIRQQVREAQAAAREAAEDAAREGAQAGLPPTAPLPPLVGTAVERPWDNSIPPQAESISIAFFITVAAIIIGLPIMRAIARRIERGTPPPAVPQEVRDQLQQINQSVEAIAIEVERISEGQRFTTKLLTEQPQQSSRVIGGQ